MLGDSKPCSARGDHYFVAITDSVADDEANQAMDIGRAIGACLGKHALCYSPSPWQAS